MEIFLALMFNFIGMIIFFLIKFLNRKNKKTTPTLTFWWQDNKIEVIVNVLVNYLLIGLKLANEINLNFIGLLPESIVPEGKGDLLSCALIGLFISFVFYTLISAKVKTISTNEMSNEKVN